MQTTISYIRETFYRQIRQNDCGIACLQSIFAYTGFNHPGNMAHIMPIDNKGLSLLQLRDLAVRFNLTARCVEMDLSFLKTLAAPVILHVITKNNFHFVVFYGSLRSGESAEYIIGDPAEGLVLWSESQLVENWVSHAALYFEELKPVGKRLKMWVILQTLKGDTPLSLHGAVAGLSIFTAVMGISSALMIPQILNSIKVNGTVEVVTALSLFLIILLLRAGLSYLRQILVIELMAGLNLSLGKLILSSYKKPQQDKPDAIFRESQKIPVALNTFFSQLLPDTFIALVIICVQLYHCSVLACLNIAGLLILGVMTGQWITAITDTYWKSEQYLRTTAGLFREVSEVGATNAEQGVDHKNLYLRLEANNREEKLNAFRLARPQHILLSGASLLICLNFLVSFFCLAPSFEELTTLMNCNFMTILLTFLSGRIIQSFQTVYAGLKTSREVIIKLGSFRY